MTEMAIALRGQRAVRVSHLAAALVCLVGLLAPALWNGYPLLQYDTGGYLARWYEGYLVPSRSTLFGLFLHLGEGFHFWPELVLQSGCTIWVIWLALRAFGLGTGPWRLVVVVTGLSLFTAVSVLCSTLLTDIFAGLAVLSLHLLLFHCSGLSRSERLGLLSLIAFSAATHSATVAVLLAVLIAYVPASMLAGLRLSRLLPPAGAIATGATMLLAANFALSGQLVWTPGGFGIAFGRMLEDGLSSAISTTIAPMRGSSCVLIAVSCREAPMSSCGVTAFLMSSAASTGLARRCALLSCTACKSIRCNTSRPRLSPPRPSLAWSRPGTGSTSESGTLMGSSSTSFREKCRQRKKRANNTVSCTSTLSIGCTCPLRSDQ